MTTEQAAKLKEGDMIVNRVNCVGIVVDRSLCPGYFHSKNVPEDNLVRVQWYKGGATLHPLDKPVEWEQFERITPRNSELAAAQMLTRGLTELFRLFPALAMNGIGHDLKNWLDVANGTERTKTTH